MNNWNIFSLVAMTLIWLLTMRTLRKAEQLKTRSVVYAPRTELEKAAKAERDSLRSEAKALRTALIYTVGYTSRLEDEIRLQFAAGRSRDLLDTAPPILAMIDAINTKDWALFDRLKLGRSW